MEFVSDGPLRTFPTQKKEEDMTTLFRPPHQGQAHQDLFVRMLHHEKKQGWFVEIGANHPVIASNTFLLEKDLGWKGLMIESDPQYLPMYESTRPKSIGVIGDATTLDYSSLLREHSFPTMIDYLQVDLDADNSSTIQCLELLDRDVLEQYKFGVVTFEHDIYRGDFYDTRKKSREILRKRGYIQIFSDVSVWEHERWCPFEDWYGHPDIIKEQLLNRIRFDPQSYKGIGSPRCIEIIEKHLSML